MQDTNTLRAHLAQLATERQNLIDQQSPLNARINELHEIITQTTAALNDRARHWQQEGDLKSRLISAKKEIGPIAQKLQILERRDSELSLREFEYRNDLARAEYANTTASDVRAEMGEAISWMRDADARLAQFASQQTDLKAKQKAAKRAANEVKAAESELDEAREALEQQKGEAFVAGLNADLAIYITEVTVAEKRLAEAKRESDAAVAALPIIAKKLAALARKVESANADSEMALKRYWAAHTRLYEVKYRHEVEGLIETANTLRALDRKTGRQLGSKIYEAIRGGLKVPTTEGSDYPQPVKLTGNDETLCALLDRLESELEAALAVDDDDDGAEIV
ncbi:MAG: hypothetical protein ABS89_00195 [Thiobacillus sp. SCN 63-1177]|nr:MAG: hypothetical protein ABS89_00195 [Thiobacillus sp. SCN 63-1177]